MSVRETTYAPGELIHPTVIDGRPLWISPEVQEFVDRLHYGDPTLGWEGDPRLALYADEGDRWVLERYENDGKYRVVCRSAPGIPLDNRLIHRLIEHDHRRGFDAEQAVDEYRPFHQSTDADDAMREGLERAYFGAAKDLGVV